MPHHIFAMLAAQSQKPVRAQRAELGHTVLELNGAQHEGMQKLDERQCVAHKRDGDLERRGEDYDDRFARVEMELAKASGNHT